MARYWASCSPGLQFALIAELQKLEHTDIMCDSLILGGVVFSTFSAPTEVLKLRSADNVYAFVGKFQGLPFERDAAVSYLKELTGLADWELPLDLFWKWKSHTFEISLEKGKSLDSTAMVKDNKVNSKSISFRVSCDRACVTMKKHGFTSMEAAAALGEGVCKRFGWPANMRSYDLEVLAWIRDDEVVLALALLYRALADGKTQGGIEEERFKIEVHDKSFSSCSGEISKTDDFAQQDKSLGKTLKRSPRASRADSQLYARRRYRKALVSTSLKPSVAHALLQLGCILPGNVILDPMCGSGTIPLEAIDWLGNQVFCMAGDIATQAMDATFENGNASGDVLQCDLLRWDASNLPLRKGVVDRIVCDMPFGVRCGTSRSRESLCPKVLKEVVRVLQLGTGVAILLGQSKAVRHEVETKQKPFLNLLQNLPIQMEGLRVEILVVQRTMEPYYA